MQLAGLERTQPTRERLTVLVDDLDRGSPAWNAPSTARTPIGRSDLWASSARRAPASTTIVPHGRSANAIHCLRAARRSTRGTKSVPSGSPSSTRDTTRSSRPEHTTVGTPKRPATAAASTLLRIPPVPTPDVAPPDTARACARSVTSDISAAPFAGIAVVEAGDIGEDHEQVRTDERAHERGELIVVAELDLVGRDGVVLVDDGHRAEPQELAERQSRGEGSACDRARRRG